MPRASSSETGPTAAIGRSSPSTAGRDPDVRSARGASAVKRSSHSPHVALCGQAASSSTSGRAKAVRWARLSMSRSICPTRAESGSSRCASRSCSSNSPRKPRSRRRQRSGSPPITAESTISFSHFHGALNAPATTISSSPFTRPAVGPFSSSSSGCASTRAKPVTASSAGMAGSGARAASSRVRHLSEGQVFGESDGREALDRAGEHGQECPAAGMRPASAALEPARDAGAIEGVFEQADVVGRACAARRQCDRSERRRAPPARSGGQFRRTRGLRRAPRTRCTSPVGTRSGGCRPANRLRRSAVRSEWRRARAPPARRRGSSR